MMNDNTAEGVVKQRADTLDDSDAAAESNAIIKLDIDREDKEKFELSVLAENSEISDIQEARVDKPPREVGENSSTEVAVNWAALFWSVPLLVSVAVLIYTKFDSLMGLGRLTALENLPFILGGVTLISLLALFWSIFRYNKKQGIANFQRSQKSEAAVIKLLNEMEDLAQGDLTVQAAVTNEVTGAIADSINLAVAEISGLVTSVKSGAVELDNVIDSIESPIDQMLGNNGVHSQEIEKAAAAADNMVEAIRRMSESANCSTQHARKFVEVAHKRVEEARNTVSRVNQTRNHIQESTKQLKRIGDGFQQINEIVRRIHGITEQINILSLNALIQSAIAEEAGRGFAVVAEEVQQLSERSGCALNEITDLLKNLQQDANSAITMVETTTESVEPGAVRAEEVGKVLREIESINQELLDTIKQVGEDERKEFKVAQTLLNRMKILQSSAAESDLSVAQVGVALEQMKSAADKVHRSIAEFKLPES